MRYRNERDVCNRTVQRTGDGALDIEYGIGGQLSVGHLTPRDGEVTARPSVYTALTVDAASDHQPWTGLHQSVDFVHAHRLDGVRSNSEAPTMAPFGKTTRSLSVSTASANFTSLPSFRLTV